MDTAVKAVYLLLSIGPQDGTEAWQSVTMMLCGAALQNLRAFAARLPYQTVLLIARALAPVARGMISLSTRRKGLLKASLAM